MRKPAPERHNRRDCHNTGSLKVADELGAVGVMIFILVLAAKEMKEGVE